MPENKFNQYLGSPKTTDNLETLGDCLSPITIN